MTRSDAKTASGDGAAFACGGSSGKRGVPPLAKGEQADGGE